VPDTYQGTEFWDLSFVDPDNRRAVNYEARAQGLDSDEPTSALLEYWRDGRIKQRLLSRLLADRAAVPALYANGNYEVLKVQGEKAQHVVAFTRAWGNERLAVIVPRLLHRLGTERALPLGSETWGDTSAILPAGLWHDVLTGAEVESAGTGHLVADIFTTLPVAAMRARA
jgi:(1->4)-alpha-D-glucan 1-alpha-D-glucosylmutase